MAKTPFFALCSTVTLATQARLLTGQYRSPVYFPSCPSSLSFSGHSLHTRAKTCDKNHVYGEITSSTSMKYLTPVVQRLDNAIHRINHCPADSVVCFVNTYPLDSDLSGGQRYPAFEQPGPEVLCGPPVSLKTSWHCQQIVSLYNVLEIKAVHGNLFLTGYCPSSLLRSITTYRSGLTNQSITNSETFQNSVEYYMNTGAWLRNKNCI